MRDHVRPELRFPCQRGVGATARYRSRRLALDLSAERAAKRAGRHTSRVRRPDRWFTEGAAALRRALAATGRSHALPPTGEYYACPLCLKPHGRAQLDAGLLTREDVPPRWAGGRPLLLTCKPCNDRAGSELDGQAAHREAQHDFLANRAPDRALPAEFTVGDVTTRGTCAGSAMPYCCPSCPT
jgi:hypothetical protein